MNKLSAVCNRLYLACMIQLYDLCLNKSQALCNNINYMLEVLMTSEITHILPKPTLTLFFSIETA